MSNTHKSYHNYMLGVNMLGVSLFGAHTFVLI